MRSVWAIAVITYKEGVRTRALYGIFLLALLLFFFTYSFSNLFMREVLKVAIDLSLSGVSLAGLLLTLYVGTNLMAKDLDKRTIHLVLSKAISRPVYVMGKYLGMVLLIGSSMAILGTMAAASVYLVDLLTLDQYGVVHWPGFFLSLVASLMKLILLCAVIFLFSSFTSNSFITLGLTVVVYLIGESTSEIKAFLEAGAEGAEISPLIIKLVEMAYYVFPNLSAFDLKMQAAHGLPVEASFLGWLFAYGMFYSLIMILMASWVFRRREFP